MHAVNLPRNSKQKATHAVVRLLALIMLCLAIDVSMAAKPEKVQNLQILYYGHTPSIDPSFSSFASYEPSARMKTGSDGSALRSKYEQELATQLKKGHSQQLKEAVFNGLNDAFASGRTVTKEINQPLWQPLDKNASRAIDKLDYMEKRGAPITIVVTEAGIKSTSDGTLTNPHPITPGPDGIASPSLGNLFTFGSAFRDPEEMMKDVKPLEFTGTSTLTFEMKYILYAANPFTKLREGKVGPVSVQTAVWNGKWAFPLGGNGAGLDKKNIPIFLKYATDNRSEVYGKALQELLPKIRSAVRDNFRDATEIISAGRELASASAK